MPDRSELVDPPIGPGAGPAEASSSVTTRPLLRWVTPTRGYVVAASLSGALLLVAGLGWQLWALLAPHGPRTRGGEGWSVASIVVLVVAYVVLVEAARRPLPRAVGPRDPARQAKARTREERRVVRRARWRGVLPAQRRLQRATAHRLEHHAVIVIQIPFYLFAAAGAFGTIAVLGSRAGGGSMFILGVGWTFIAALLLGMLVWLRYQARRLNQAFLEHERYQAPRS